MLGIVYTVDFRKEWHIVCTWTLGRDKCPIFLAQRPAVFTKFSHAINPNAVITPETDPFLVRTSRNSQFSTNLHKFHEASHEKIKIVLVAQKTTLNIFDLTISPSEHLSSIVYILTSLLSPSIVLLVLYIFQKGLQLHRLEPTDLLQDRPLLLTDKALLIGPCQLLFHTQPFDVVLRTLV